MNVFAANLNLIYSRTTTTVAAANPKLNEHRCGRRRNVIITACSQEDWGVITCPTFQSTDRGDDLVLLAARSWTVLTTKSDWN